MIGSEARVGMGVTEEPILEDHPGPTVEDIRAGLTYAHAALAGEEVCPLAMDWPLDP